MKISFSNLSKDDKVLALKSKNTKIQGNVQVKFTKIQGNVQVKFTKIQGNNQVNLQKYKAMKKRKAPNRRLLNLFSLPSFFCFSRN